MKRVLIIIASIIVLVGIGVGIYLFFFAKTGGLALSPTNSFPSSGDSVSSETAATRSQELGVAIANAGTEVAPRLIRISDAPVAVGASAVFVAGKVSTTTTSSTTPSTTAYTVDPDVRVSYIERESGNVYEFISHARTLTRTSNKTLPGIQEAVWAQDGSLAFARFLERIGVDERVSTFALPHTGEGGYLLQNNISQVLVTGSSTLITLAPTSDGSIATVSTLAGGSVSTLFTSAFSSLRLSVGKGLLLATTKAGVKSKGFAFTVDTKSGAFTRVLGPLSGLTTLVSPSGRYILYSYTDKKSVVLSVFDTALKSATRLPLSTVTEKCTWSSDSLSVFCGVPTTLVGTYPDDWYQGVVHSSDRLWRIDVADRVATQLIDPKTAGNVDIDAVGLSVDATTDILVFTNKTDKTLWLYDL